MNHSQVVPGFLRGASAHRGALGAGPASVFASLSTAQQAWVLGALAAWFSAGGTQAWYNVNSGACPGVVVGMDLTNPTNFTALVNCFQAFYNAQSNQGGNITTGGTLDQMTLAALMGTYVAAGGAQCPGNCAIAPSQPAASSSSSTGWIVGGVAAAVVAVGALWYMERHKHAARPAMGALR